MARMAGRVAELAPVPSSGMGRDRGPPITRLEDDDAVREEDDGKARKAELERLRREDEEHRAAEFARLRRYGKAEEAE
jgi:hypothetical protein